MRGVQMLRTLQAWLSSHFCLGMRRATRTGELTAAPQGCCCFHSSGSAVQRSAGGSRPAEEHPQPLRRFFLRTPTRVAHPGPGTAGGQQGAPQHCRLQRARRPTQHGMCGGRGAARRAPGRPGRPDRDNLGASASLPAPGTVSIIRP